MNTSKMHVAVLFGGQSGEHEVSLVSAQSVINAIDKDRYTIETIWISKTGQWFWGLSPEKLLSENLSHQKEGIQVTLVIDPTDPRFMALDGTPLPNEGRVDLVFPVLHGPYGEDGTIQGLLEMTRLPYVGSGVLGSALGMDKDRMKAVFKEAGLPICKHLTFLRSKIKENIDDCISRIEREIGYPSFVKPANLGSSVGVSKAHNREELITALETAASFDRKIIVEETIIGHEIEVSVLGNDHPEASIAGEILPGKEFYDYEAKYQDAGSQLLIPAPLDDETMKKLQETAIKAYQAVNASGLSRVDFFVTDQGKIILNEINTMPGFTSISMYPKLWDYCGIPYSKLIDRLIELGLERFQDMNNRKISHEN